MKLKFLYHLVPAFIIALTLDLASKFWIEQNLIDYTPVPIIGDFFRLTLGYNTGVAFGLMSDTGIWPLVATGIGIVVLAVWLVRSLMTEEMAPLAGWPIGFLLGGAIGNFVDRWPDGRVTDFLDVGLGATRWPTFNLADSFIVVGLVVLVIISYQAEPSPKPTTSLEPPHLEPEVGADSERL